MKSTLMTDAERMHALAHQFYRDGLILAAQANLLEILHEAQALNMDARWVGLVESDQSFDGDQFVVGCWKDDGTVLDPDGEAFQEIGMDICDRNKAQWERFVVDVDLDTGESRPERFLDVQKILEAARLRETHGGFPEPLTYRVIERLAACKLTDEIDVDELPEDDTSTLDHFIGLAREVFEGESE